MIDLIRQIAKTLYHEARWREDNRDVQAARPTFLWRWLADTVCDEVPPEHTLSHDVPLERAIPDNTPVKHSPPNDRPIEFSARVLVYPHWTHIVFLHLNKKNDARPAWEEVGYLTVYFGRYADDVERPNRNPKELRAVQRQMRQILRLRKFPPDTDTALFKDQPDSIAPGNIPAMARYKVMIVDKRTPLETIVEQLALICLQLGTEDKSLWDYLSSRHKSMDVMLALIENFVDPQYPGSYAAYVARLRRGARRKTRNAEEISCQNISPEMTVSQAAQQANCPLSTLYDLIKRGDVIACRDGRGLLRISQAEVQRLARLMKERADWKELQERRAEETGYEASRKWIQRQKAKGRNPRDLEKALSPVKQE